jgi:hypothetical protein
MNIIQVGELLINMDMLTFARDHPDLSLTLYFSSSGRAGETALRFYGEEADLLRQALTPVLVVRGAEVSR